MIRSIATTTAIAFGALISSVSAETINDAWCTLDLYDHTVERESFTCSFTHTTTGVEIKTKTTRTFNFPHSEQGNRFNRQNTPDFIRFNSWGDYTLTVFKDSACAPSREACI